MGRVNDADDLLDPLVGPARESGWHEVRCTVALRVAASVGREAAVPLLRAALEAARASGCRPLEEEAHLALADVLGTSGDREGAEAHAVASERLAVALAASIQDREVRNKFLALRDTRARRAAAAPTDRYPNRVQLILGRRVQVARRRTR